MSLKFIKRIILLPIRIIIGIRYAANLHDTHELMQQNKASIRFCGEGSRIEDNVAISWPSRLRLGKQCLVQRDCVLHSMGGIHVGNYVGIGKKSTLVSFAHNYLRPEYLPYDNVITLKPIVIRDFVWIGFAAHVMPGVEIGEGAIVSLGATVTKNVPPLAVVSGNPAEIVGYRNKKQFEMCKENKKFAGPRTSSFFGEFKEIIPKRISKKYNKELRELGIVYD
ncbi:MAG: acyltransferase [Candidatus Electrothrix sp. GW3-4]|uniref:acyltransferase n=1 Tax=Candidatus Electrothrix sp. GW3-4 TaxID=3126740 RepID=UPI0030D417BD